MNSFPERFKSENTDKFHQYKQRKDLKYLRKRIYDHYLSIDYKQKNALLSKPFYATPYMMERKLNPKQVENLIIIIQLELKKNKWFSFYDANKQCFYLSDNNEELQDIVQLL